MINSDEAKVFAWNAIAELFGLDYFREHFYESYQAFPEDNGQIQYEYFMGFEDKDDLWTVFARVEVNRETKQVVFLDYKCPDGKRMENPIKPVRLV